MPSAGSNTCTRVKPLTYLLVQEGQLISRVNFFGRRPDSKPQHTETLHRNNNYNTIRYDRRGSDRARPTVGSDTWADVHTHTHTPICRFVCMFGCLRGESTVLHLLLCVVIIHWRCKRRLTSAKAGRRIARDWPPKRSHGATTPNRGGGSARRRTPPAAMRARAHARSNTIRAIPYD